MYVFELSILSELLRIINNLSVYTESLYLSIEWSLLRLGGPVQGIVTKIVHFARGGWG